MRQKKKILLAGILCCMCLGSVCVSIRSPGKVPTENPGRADADRRTEATGRKTNRSTKKKTGRKKQPRNRKNGVRKAGQKRMSRMFRLQKQGIAGGNKGGNHGTV